MYCPLTLKKIRAHAVITGRVQGVFFRMETKRAADHAGVLGWVRNKMDGDVEALFEGDEESVKSVLEWCGKGPPLACVKNVDVEFEDYKGEFKEFEITY
ncbi:MAG: acylphosphatase [Desulfobacteraceae bacterium]|nr:acylphosphatase [Pseudomonadota bacterium]MBU4463771.1 acylphosphatase [Pseudomonadota bacterium]MCG2754632.1 acylphosphatase [Desulfobacteraceae bacterium]NQT09979.1 acylphosphatase [Desulfobacteraceae bacterium]